MSSITWTPDAVSSEAGPFAEKVWRMVEAQYIASTMKLVDTAAEQDLLESILEEAKPPVPEEAKNLDYLLSTPFRYYPLPPGSRFRSSTDPGIFYGSDSVQTAAAEVGFWRWKFVQESEGLDRLGPAPHSAFSVPVETQGVDLRRPPFDRDAPTWTNPFDYSGTQAFGQVAREAGIGIIVYRSVRSPVATSWCGAILSPLAFATKTPDSEMQTWHLMVTQDEVTWRRSLGEALSFVTKRWDRGRPLQK